MDQKAVRRSGLDYHDLAMITEFPNWELYLLEQSKRKFAISTKGTVSYNHIKYQPNDILVFGPETRGLPDGIRKSDAFESVIKIPMQPNNRSLNLSNSVAIVLYEAWRQLSFTGAQT